MVASDGARSAWRRAATASASRIVRSRLPPAIARTSVVGVAAAEQLAEEGGEAPDVGQALGQRLAAVEVAADPDVVDARRRRAGGRCGRRPPPSVTRGPGFAASQA